MGFVRETWSWRFGVVAFAALLTASVFVAPVSEALAAPVALPSVPGGDDDETTPEWKHARQVEAASQRPAKHVAKPSAPPRVRSHSRGSISSRHAPAPFQATFNQPLHC